jgi:hypothetical protein
MQTVRPSPVPPSARPLRVPNLGFLISTTVLTVLMVLTGAP